MEISSPDISKEDVSTHDVDFFTLINELTPLIEGEKNTSDYLFWEAIKGKFSSSEANSYSIISRFINDKIKQKNRQLNSNEITFQKYVKYFQTNYKLSSFNQFLFFIQLYSIGKIGHRTFINLIFNLINQTSPKEKLTSCFEVKFLPLFMASLNQLSKNPNQNYELPINEEYAIELVVGLTSFAGNNDNPKTSKFDLGQKLSKCFQCLCSGTITVEHAKYWLSQYFPSSFYHKLDLLDDFRLLSPYRFPPEIIGCIGFRPKNLIKHPSYSVSQQYKLMIQKKHSMCSLSQSAVEVYERELFLISEIFKTYCRSKSIKIDQLKPFFNKKLLDNIAKLFSKRTANKELYCLSKRFETAKQNCLEYLYKYENNHVIYQYKIKNSMQWIDYRYIHDIHLRPLIRSRYLELPGTYPIQFKGIRESLIAIAFVAEFINVYFNHERASLLNRALAVFVSLFVDTNKEKELRENIINKSKAISETQLTILTYLSEITHTIASCGDVSLIEFSESEEYEGLPRFTENDYPDNNFARFVVSVAKRLKNKEIIYKNVQPFYENQKLDINLARLYNIDLILIKICQFLNLAAKKNEFEFVNCTKLFHKKKIGSIIRQCAYENEETSVIISSILSIL